MDSSFADQLVQVAQRQVGNDAGWPDAIIRKELVEINMLLHEFRSTGCLLTDLGEYLCRATETTAQLAQRVANGNHIHTFAQLSVNQIEKQTDLSELDSLDAIAAKHLTLKLSHHNFLSERN